jgi:hypothetical protein
MSGDTFTVISDLRGRVAELEAEIVGLKQSLALDEISMRANGVGQWSPVACDSSIACDCGCGAELFAWCNPDSIEAVNGDVSISIHLPDGYALCKKNEGHYITVHRSYIENLEAKANVLK